MFFFALVLPISCAPSYEIAEPLDGYANCAWLEPGKVVSVGSPEASVLYTICIHNPSSGYTGLKKAGFSIKGLGNFRESPLLARLRSSSIASKSAPQGTANWTDLILYDYEGRMSDASASYWFTDETNRMRYYISDKAKDGILTDLDASYWDGMRDLLLGGVMAEGLFEKEKESYGLPKRGRNGDGYLNVVAYDFGKASVEFENGNWYGIVGLYDQINLRPKKGLSNEADMFFINMRYIEGMTEWINKGYSREDAVDLIVTTLLHECMHYLMDLNILNLAEEEFKDDMVLETGTICDQNGYVEDGKYSAAVKLATSQLRGSSFWIEGTANSAPYRLLGETDSSAVASWLGDMAKWRPSIAQWDDGASNAGNEYATYGAGGLFFSYLAQTRGEEIENLFHQWRDSAHDAEGDAPDHSAVRAGDINVMARRILGEEFKDAYARFLRDCLLSLNPDAQAPDDEGARARCFGPWGFTREDVDEIIDRSGFRVDSAAEGFRASDLPELSFVINRWDEIPQYLMFQPEGDAECFALWL